MATRPGLGCIWRKIPTECRVRHCSGKHRADKVCFRHHPTLEYPTMTSLVREVPAAPSDIALEHFSRRLTFETDCSDVHASQQAGEVDFVLVDVRGPLAFERGHVPGAINLRSEEHTSELQ